MNRNKPLRGPEEGTFDFVLKKFEFISLGIFDETHGIQMTPGTQKSTQDKRYKCTLHVHIAAVTSMAS